MVDVLVLALVNAGVFFTGYAIGRRRRGRCILVELGPAVPGDGQGAAEEDHDDDDPEHDPRVGHHGRPRS